MRRLASLFLQNAFLRNSLVLFAGTMVANVLNYLFHLIVGRMVDPEAYGEIESLLSLLAIISVPAGTLTLLATKYAATMKAKADFQGTYALSRFLMKRVLLYGLPMLLAISLFTPFVKRFLNINDSLPLFLLWGIMFFSFLSAATSGILTGWQKFSHTSLVGIFATVLKVGIVFVFLKLSFSVSGVIGSFVVSTVLVYVANLFLLRHFFQKDASHPQEQFSFPGLKSYILPAFFGTLSLAILGNVDMIFAQHHLNATASGEYSALSVAAKTIFFATGVLTTVLFAMSAEEHNRKEKGSRTFFLAFCLTILVVSFSLVLFSLFPEFVVSLLFGEKYLAVSHFLPWFALAAGLYSIANLVLQYLLSLHETKIPILFLFLALFEIVALFFLGEDFYAIISITIGAQILAIVLGFCFIFKKKESHVQEDFGGYTGI